MTDKQIIPHKVAVAEPEKVHELERAMTPSLVAATMGMKVFRQIGVKGDLVAILTQIKVAGANKDEPALVIANKRDPRNKHVYIPLSQLWAVLDENYMDTYVAEFAQRVYGFVTRPDLFRVKDALYEFAEDLVHALPPMHLGNKEWTEALLKDDWRVGKAANH